MKTSQFSLFLLFSLFANALAEESVDWKSFVEENSFRNAYGIYLQGEKMGWTTDELFLGEHDGQAAAVSKTAGLIRVELLGEKMEMEYVEEIFYELKGEGKIFFARSHSSEQDKETLMLAEANEKGFAVAVEAEESESNFQTLPSKDTLMNFREFLSWIREERKVGDSFDLQSFDFEKIAESARSDDEIDPDRLEPHRYLEGGFEQVGGVESLVHRVSFMMDGAEIEVRVLPDGTLLSGFIGPFEIRLEPEEIAKQFDVATINSLSVIPVDAEVGEPTEIDTLKVKISGTKFDFPESDRQKVISKDEEAEEVVLELKAQLDDSITHELTEEEREKFTAPTAKIQSDHPKIRKRAEKIVKGKEETAEKIAALNSWVFNKLSFAIGDNSSTALRVLETRSGDCTECALLFVALARSLGIPAREVGGYTYSEDFEGFWAHAWAQVHDGTRWIDIDPAWDEFPVNATHIQTSIVDQPMADIALYGKIEIEVLSLVKKAR